MYISLGGWCGTTMSLRSNSMYGEALPFDHIRATFDGVIDCIENDFINFFPKKLEVDKIDGWEYSNRSYRGKYFGFYHHNLLDGKVRSDFIRRMNRFNNILKNSKKVTFIRTTVTEDYEDELKLTSKFKEVMSKKYPNIEYVLVYIIPEQKQTNYYKNIDNNVFVFTLNDLSHELDNLALEYRPILNFIKKVDLFKTIPKSNNIGITKQSRLWLVHGEPMVRSDN